MNAKEMILDRIEPDPNTGCWYWFGAVHHTGYGVIRVAGRQFRAHRFSFEAFGGLIPAGLVLDHLCRQRLCVNPAHLEVVTERVNILRGKSPSAVNAQKSQCPSGHDYESPNAEGKRRCLQCRNACDRRRRVPAKTRMEQADPIRVVRP